VHSCRSFNPRRVKVKQLIVKAAPQVGQRHGETVCCAGIDLYGNWLRLYPVSFRTLEDDQKFGRWDRIKFKWRRPSDDPRIESRRVDQQSIEIVGQLKRSEREKFLAKSIVTSLSREREAGRSFALLKPEKLEFKIQRKTDDDITEERRSFETLRTQPDLFNTAPVIPYVPCPYQFRYKYKIDDGFREGTCQDWEIEATFFKIGTGSTARLTHSQRCGVFSARTTRGRVCSSPWARTTGFTCPHRGTRRRPKAWTS